MSEHLTEKLRFWENFSLYAETHTPEVRALGTYARFMVSPPRHLFSRVALNPIRLCLMVNIEDGLVELDEMSFWFGAREEGWDVAIRQEVWEYLREQELVELRPIGPEDSEYFATSKLQDALRRRDS